MDKRANLVEIYSNNNNNNFCHDSNPMIKNLCDSLPIIQCNEDFTIVYANDRLSDIFNLSKEYIIGKSIFETILSEATPAQNSIFIRSFDNDHSDTHQCELSFSLNACQYRMIWYNSTTVNNLHQVTRTSVILDISNVKDLPNTTMANPNAEAIAEINPEGDILYANKEFFTLFEISQSAKIANYKAKEFIDTSNYIDNPQFSYDNAIRNEGIINIKLLTAKNKLFTTEVKIEPLYDNNNRYYATRIHFPHKINHSQEVSGFSPLEIIENLSDFIAVIGTNTEIKYISPNFREFLGVSPDDRNEVITLDYIHYEDKYIVSNQIKNVSLIPGSTIKGKFRFKSNSGEYAWMDAVITNYLNNPAIQGLLTSIRLSRETTFTEEFHAKQGDNLHIIAKYANILMLVLNLEGKIILSEGKALSKFGMNASHILGSKITDIIHFEENSKVDFQNAMAGEETRTVFSIQNSIFDGIFSPYFDSNNRQIGVVLVSTDITEKSKIDREKEELIKALQSSRETIIDESNKLWELNDKLAESEKNLIKSNSEKDKFFSIISHDLRSPLSGITGMLESLFAYFDSYSPNEIKESIKGLLDSSKNLYKLLDNLLLWSRIQRGVMVNNPDYLPAKIIVNNVFDLLNYTASQKGISIITKVEEELTIYADFNMINTTLRNLVSNAIKFTQSGGSITITAKSIANSFAQFSVQDTGVGMTKEDINKLFKLDDNHTTPGTNNEQGTGLGLILCKEMVNQNKGNIWVESELGVGSTFSFTVPIDAIFLEQNEENFETFSGYTSSTEEEINNVKYYQICLTDREYHPSQELLEVLPEIISELEVQFIPLRDDLLNTIVVNDVIDFALNLRKFGEEWQLQCVIDYSIALYDKCKTMDLEQIHTLLLGFDTIISRLKSFIGIYE